jgi:tetratricopeptide (TPR) repeat protein
MATITVEQALQLASTYQSMGQSETAAALYRQVVNAQPAQHAAWHQLGMLALNGGRYTEALELMSKAVAQCPTQALYHAGLGVAQRQLQQLAPAIASYQRALAADPDLAEVHSNLGEVLAYSGRISEAIASCERAVQLRPDYPDALNNLGLALAQDGQHQAAFAAFERARTLQPNSPATHNNVGRMLQKIGQWSESIAAFDQAIALRPSYAQAHANRGASLLAKGEWEAALSALRSATEYRPDFADAWWNIAFLNLLQGHFEEGWQLFEWRLRSRGFAAHRKEFSVPPWTGEKAPKQTILVHAEQGFGDTIQFLRYLPLVRKHSGAANILLECQPELLRLIKGTKRAGVEVIAAPRGADATSVPEFDRHIPLLSVPLAVKQFEPLPMDKPYLRAEAKSCTVWRKRLGKAKGLRVGLAWSGRKTHEGDRERSIAPERLLPLLRTPGMRFYSLQIDANGNLPATLAEAGLHDLTAEITDFADTAAIMSELDLVITVDTAAAHLAGALGCAVWTLLPFVPDWRWGLEREDTPWYPTMRLFRQKAAGDWDEVIQRVAEALPHFKP